MGYDESLLRLNKKDMKYFVENIDKYAKAFDEFGTSIYCHIKLLKPLHFAQYYGLSDGSDLPTGDYIWVGGERRGFAYAMDESELLSELKRIELNPTFLSNYNHDEIKSMQTDTSFAIVTEFEDIESIKRLYIGDDTCKS